MFVLLSKSITYGMEKKFKSRYSEYGDADSELAAGYDLSNAIYLVNKDVITIETVHNAATGKSKISMNDLATIYESLGKFGESLYLDSYVYKNPSIKTNENNVQGDTNSTKKESALAMFMNALMTMDEPNRYEKEDVLQEYIKFYISSMKEEDASEQLEEVLNSYSELVNSKSIEKSYLINSFKALSTYRDMDLLDKHNHKLVVDSYSGIKLVKLQ